MRVLSLQLSSAAFLTLRRNERDLKCLSVCTYSAVVVVVVVRF